MMRRLVVVSLAAASLSTPVWAQTAAAPPAKAASGIAISDRIKRDADRPMYWIRLHAAENPKGAAPAAPSAADARKPTVTIANTPGTPVAATPAATPAAAGNATGAAKTAAVAPNAPATASTAALPRNLPPTSAGNPGKSAADATALPSAESVAMASPSSLPANLGPASGTLPTPQTAVAEPTPAAAQPAVALELLTGDPEFPQHLMRRLRKGEVQVRVNVLANGEVGSAIVLSASHPKLEQAAVDAIKTWRFKPPQQPASGVINFQFDLDS
jgi:TonB family protein